ncbi:hypothetical protein FHX37_3971 [Haloactinospora alba]|uniref:Uncharacterized protein n=1 Tax=Haloactinospora alba TaxID=405555 RepID=A0A543N9U7_9ACTN|nr:hypothetical protein [Haloactinospora alba]TQN28614.1 hypothetical protein FHX37_3971 [Haloactinospora alba]
MGVTDEVASRWVTTVAVLLLALIAAVVSWANPRAIRGASPGSAVRFR